MFPRVTSLKNAAAHLPPRCFLPLRPHVQHPFQAPRGHHRVKRTRITCVRDHVVTMGTGVQEFRQWDEPSSGFLISPRLCRDTVCVGEKVKGRWAQVTWRFIQRGSSWKLFADVDVSMRWFESLSLFNLLILWWLARASAHEPPVLTELTNGEWNRGDLRRRRRIGDRMRPAMKNKVWILTSCRKLKQSSYHHYYHTLIKLNCFNYFNLIFCKQQKKNFIIQGKKFLYWPNFKLYFTYFILYTQQ